MKTLNLHHIEVALVSADKGIVVFLDRRVFLRTFLDDFFFLLLLSCDALGSVTADFAFRSEEQLVAESALAYCPLVLVNELPDLRKDSQQAVITFTEHIECVIIGSDNSSARCKIEMLHSHIVVEIRFTGQQAELRIEKSIDAFRYARLYLVPVQLGKHNVIRL